MTTPTQGEHDQTEALAHELFAAAQLAPGEGIEDAVSRIAAALTAAPQGAAYAELPDVDALAQEIRRVDGSHNLGAGALAEALMPFLRASNGQAPAGAAADWIPFSKRMAIADRHGVKVTAEFNSLLRDVIRTYLETHTPTAQAAPAAGAVAGPNMEALRHSANEWADMATNGLQWLRNIVAGASDAKTALENMESNLAHCRAVNDAPEVQAAIRAAAAPTPAAQADSQPSSFGSPELQAMILARCVEKDKADSVLEDAALLALTALHSCTAGGYTDVDGDFVRTYYFNKVAVDAAIKALAARKQGGTHDNH